jgi:hypothetical protein
VEEAMDEHAWLQKSEEILTDIKEWRRAHPKATFVEIEDEEHPQCPTCAVPLHARGKHKRTLQGNGGQSVTLNRTYGTCPTCGESLFPPG